MTSQRLIVTLVCGVVFLGSGACRLDPYDTGNRGRWLDAGPPPDAALEGDRALGDACVPTVEVCDGLDNDCNGIVDDASNLETDVSNCGECGRVCEFAYAVATCEASQCVMGDCFPGHHDVNADPVDGCEYTCTITNLGVEACDGRDNDCNGQVDEGFDLTSDPNNCGSCRNTCVFLNGVGACVSSTCQMGGCKGGFRDLDGNVANGCECQMQMTEDATGLAPCVQGVETCPQGEECADPDRDGQSHCLPIPLDLCDGRDNDCDGVVDEDATAMVPSDVCYSYPSGCTELSPGNFSCDGPCTPGTLQCLWGALRCTGQTGPVAEICNNVDDDCNGVVDDSWDKLTDPNNCGGCGVQCGPLLPNAIPSCAGGQCAVLVCLPGYWDLDPGQPGCEYPCQVSNGGVEACGDGLDNDCDGQTDEGFDLLSDPSNCGACGHSCEVQKPFGTQVSSPGCVGGSCRFECLPNYYDRNADLPTLGEASNGCESYCLITSPTELCDGEDNDCNGQVDEGFDVQTDTANCGACGRSCEAAKGANTVVTGCLAGTCQFVCAGGFVDLNGDLAFGSAGNGCECAVSAEVCGDGLDNDCNGVVDDEGAAGCTVYYRDNDQDTFGNAIDSKCLCAPNAAARYTAFGAGDCNDANAAVKPGATEVCDGQDNDCDGQTDRDSLGAVLTRACYTGPVGTLGVGPCLGGTQTCTGGLWSLTCEGEVTPQLEVCDGVDNNCAGGIDEGFDLTSNPLHCGACDYRCADHIPSAVSTCQSSVCVVVSCLPGFYDLDPVQPGCEYACTPQNGGMKTCGSLADNDCNGTVDASEFDVRTDPLNCGDCGHNCEVFKPFGTQLSSPACVAGSCQLECLPNYYDRDGDLPTLGEASNGCEDYCVVTNPTELCDGVDNDCNGQVDEGFNLQIDTTNCGACGRSCEALKGENTVVTGCVTGTCQFVCAGGFVDLNGDLAFGSVGNGCECAVSPEICDGLDNDCNGVVDGEGVGGCTVYYRDNDQDTFGNALDSKCLCAPDAAARYTALGVGDCNDANAAIRPGATEVCDGADNDCDGQTDRDSLGVILTRACYTGPVGTLGVGPCLGGTQTCTGGLWSLTCEGEVTPQLEVCDGADNNCAGGIDEGFDLTSNPLHCGACGYRCADHVPNAVSSCQASVCVVISCMPGFYDLDPMQPGCEYACTPQNGGMKTCGSSVDNDCNGTVDASEFDVQTDPLNCGDCGHNCEVFKPFGSQVSSPACVAGSCQLECLPDFYDRDGDLPTLGEASNGCEDYCVVTGPTELCDGVDNDCNGLVDEGFSLLTDPANCGACGRSCESLKGANTVVTGCAGGNCQFACAGGFVDLNGDLAFGSAGNGCECAVGVEVCDGLDNDCNGVADDEGAGGCTVFYRDSDLDTYGNGLDSKCLCAADLAARYTALGAGDCNDANAAVRPGATEVCDGLDNDCDGQTDRDSLGAALTRVCYTGPAGTEGVGPCVGGTQTCTAGLWSPTCEGEVTPQLEVCDGVDNNCAGGIDEGFDLTSGQLHCGACNYSCADHVPNAVSACQASVCVVVACLPGFYDLDPIQPGCEYPCIPQNGGVKTCGSFADNDCNGTVDASEFDVQTDPANCGACGHNCEATKPGGTAVSSPDACVAGVCQFDCLADYRDVDGDLSTLGEGGNGCECVLTNGGVEACDSVDNDCDGDVDEDFNLQGNVDHCGACNNACSDLGDPATAHAQLVGCVAGRCTFSCLGGWNDLNGDLNSGVAFGPGNNGCEYPCSPTGAEVCDGADNDCNGLTDEGADGLPLRRSCYTGAPGTEAHLPCRQGIETCNPSTGLYDSGCLGQITPVVELCGDGVDNDCDGTADDGFDFQTDTYHCGACNHSCVAAINMPANALPDSPPCQSGQCRYVCIAGFADLNGDLNSGNPPGPGNNGCEHTCERYPPAPEECNGIDDDCDNQVDEDLPATQDICFQGAAGSLCHGVTATCQDPDGAGSLAKGWWCNYPAGVEIESGNPNAVFPVETLCDGLDGDCDSFVDDDFGVGDTCTNGGIGACRVAATVVCDTLTTTKCDLPPPASWPVPTNEVCDTVDNDCDGLVDESTLNNIPANDQVGAHDKWVVEPVASVTRADGFTSQVYLYEASRPSATDASAGVGTSVRSCSQPDVVPWSFVTYRQAARACVRAGMRLCRPQEWTEACDGQGVDWVYPYGPLALDYDTQECNGAQNAVGGGDVLTTSELGLCTSEGYGVFDLSGNLREWTTDLVGYSSSGRAIHRVRGGSYQDYASGLQCDFGNSSGVEDVPAPHIGFRCCTSCGNGNIETWEQCDGQAGCHPVLCVWQTCGNGTPDAGEQCDDGNNLPFDGCATDCTREQTCGDGIVEGGEECDDAAFLSMGICDSNCQWNFITERESNNGCAASVSAGNRHAAPVLFAGAWLSGDYSDYYAIDIPAGTHTLRVQTFDRFGPYTCALINTQVFVYNAGCGQVFYSDSNNGPGNCENGTVPNVTGPTTYYVRIRENGENTTGYYSLLVTLE